MVVSSSTGIPAASHPSLPKLTVSRPRWMAFMALRAKSLGTTEAYPQGCR